MKLPRGQLRRRRIVTDLGTVLVRALEDEVTGYARLEPQETLLLDAEAVGVVTFEAGVPTLAYDTGTGAGGPAALSEIAAAGPSRLELYELDGAALPAPAEADDLAVEPGLPAEVLAGDAELAERTREHAPSARLRDRTEESTELGAVEAFLDDEETIGSIQERAREEAAMRADEWGFTEQAGRH